MGVKAEAEQAEAKEKWLRKMAPARRAKVQAIMAKNHRVQAKRADRAAAELAKFLREDEQALSNRASAKRAAAKARREAEQLEAQQADERRQ